MHEKLAALGLVSPREKDAAAEITLDQFVEGYIATRQKGAFAKGTITNLGQTRRLLAEFFGVNQPIKGITAGRCDDWRVFLECKGHAVATISRHVKRARQFFRGAVRNKLISENPMAEVKTGSQINKTREYYVTREEIEKIIAACPDAEWRLIIALARYGGLRTPSETYTLTWEGINWETNRMHVESPKTACHEGKESRDVPIFPELLPHLEAVRAESGPGAIYVISKQRLGSMNLRTQLERIMDRAGVREWPRLFQNMRASRETELAQQYPLHVVTAWIGNSAMIAAQHYLQVTDQDFTNAIEGNGKSVGPDASRTGNGRSEFKAKDELQNDHETTPKTTTKSEAMPEAKSEAVSAAKAEAAHVGTAEQGMENRPQVLSAKRVMPRLAHSLHSVHLTQVTPTGFEPVFQA
ncbi:MAG: tyrosine-type recombinase/integrase [Pirellulales bacterium]